MARVNGRAGGRAGGASLCGVSRAIANGRCNFRVKGLWDHESSERRDHGTLFIKSDQTTLWHGPPEGPFRSGLGQRTWHHSCAAIWRGLKSNKRGPLQQGVIPLVVGAFGESSTGLLKLVKMWARHAASGDLGAAILPLADTDRKGGAFPIMHQQFLRCDWGHDCDRQCSAQTKQDPLPPTDKTRGSSGSEHTNHSRYRSNNFTQRGAQWYQRHAHEGYGGFQQFQNVQNGYDSHVP